MGISNNSNSSSSSAFIRRFLFGAIIVLLVLLQVNICSSNAGGTIDSFSYAVDSTKSLLLNEKDANGHFITHKFVPLLRTKRQVATATNTSSSPADEVGGPDKSELLKNGGNSNNNGGTKKPILQFPKSKDSSSSNGEKKTATSVQSSAAAVVPTTLGGGVGVETTIPPIKIFPDLVNQTHFWANQTRSNTSMILKGEKNDTATTTDEDDIGDNDAIPFPDEKPKKNLTIMENNHTYYTSTYYPKGQFLWIELENDNRTEVHELLSDAHRRAATVTLKFDFPFYGHIVRNVTMATGGFLYLGEHVHAWLAATQYIAPLMANFDSRFNTSFVRYLSNETQFTVEWRNVILHDAPIVGNFTFQTTLYLNGTIIFAYRDIPVEIQAVNDTNHPVKVGLSDAYISERSILFVKQKTIYEYHRIDLTNQSITNGSAIVFSAKPTCPNHKTCDECTNHKSDFDCVWCPAVGRCSDGTDRNRQEWLIKKCSVESNIIKHPVECLMSSTPISNSSGDDVYHNFGHEDHDKRHLYPGGAEESISNSNAPQSVSAVPRESGGIGASGVVGILFFLLLVLCIGGWIFYAYYFPHTPSGQLLIRFRPSQWGAFRRGEARYTAASIHM